MLTFLPFCQLTSPHVPYFSSKTEFNEILEVYNFSVLNEIISPIIEKPYIV